MVTAALGAAAVRDREEGVDLKRQAVLFRTSHHSDELEVELGRRKIPFVKYGGLIWTVFPTERVLSASLVAVGTGVFLAAVASVYPARVAARLVPMEAMRVE